MLITHCKSKADYDLAEEFLDGQTVPSPPVGLKFRFPKGFNTYSNIISPENDTWIFSSESETLAAGSLIYKTLTIEDLPQKVALTSFMRIKPDAKSTLLWAKHLLPEIHKRLKEKDCNYIFSFVFESQRQQIRDFRRAVKLKDKMPRYFLVRKASYILIQGRLPWRSHALKSVSIRKAVLSDCAEIFIFLSSQQISKKIKKIWTEDDIKNLILSGQKKTNREQLYIGVNHTGQVVGTFLPQELNQIREDIIVSASPETFSYFQFQRLLSFLGLSNRPPKLKQPVQSIYLSMIEATNPDVFESLLRFVYKTLRHRNEIISYTHYSGNLITKPPSSFMIGAIPMDLYLILPQDQNPPEFLKSYWMAPTPDLESFIF